MNTNRLYAICYAVNDAISESNLLPNIESLMEALQNQINNPVEPHQAALAEALETVYESLSNFPTDSFSPAWHQALEELGGSTILGKVLMERIQEIFQKNTITLTAAKQELSDINEKLNTFSDAVYNIITSFSNLNLGESDLGPGECEIGIVIPRLAISNELQTFGEEIKEFNFVMNIFSEVATSKCVPITIKTISSSDLSIYIECLPAVAAFTAHAISKVITTYKEYLEIKKLRNELRESLEKQGISSGMMDPINETVNSMLEERLKKAAEGLLEDYYINGDNSRRNELSNGLQLALNKLANRIDRGYNYEVRAIPPEETEEAEEPENEQGHENIENTTMGDHIEAVRSVADILKFMKSEGPSILKLPECSSITSNNSTSTPQQDDEKVDQDN